MFAIVEIRNYLLGKYVEVFMDEMKQSVVYTLKSSIE